MTDVVLVGHGYRPLPPEPADSPSIVMESLARALAALDVRVAVVCGTSQDHQRPYELRGIRPPALIGRRFTKLAEILFAAQARRVVRSIGSDVVQYYAPTPAILASRRNGSRILMEWSAPIAQSRRVATMGSLSFISALAEALALRRADKVIVKAERSAEYARRVYHVPRRKLMIIPNGVDTERFTPPVSEPVTPTVLNVARIARYKDQETLVRAMTQPPLRESSVRLLLAGPVDDSKYLDALVALARGEGIEQRVQALGAVDISVLPDLYRSATVVAFTSLAEGAVPLALLEAMSSGRAVVASAIAQHLEVGDRSGVSFVPAGDPLATSRAIADLLDDAKRRGAAGEAARRRAEQKFSWLAIADRFKHAFVSRYIPGPSAR